MIVNKPYFPRMLQPAWSSGSFHCLVRFIVLLYFGIRPSNAQDWYDSFDGPTRILNRAGQQDPLDLRVIFRGSGEINIGGGIARFRRSPRLYVVNPQETKWGDVEMTGYATVIDTGNTTNGSAGFTMAARSNHDKYRTDGCQAFGYYARITLLGGDCLFTKEYFHGTNDTVYAPSRRVPCFSSGLPANQTIGMKFTIRSLPGTSNVQLELFTDTVGDGSWVLRHEFLDEPGKWPSVTSKDVPLECTQNNGDTVLRPGNVCFFRADGTSTSVVHWTNVSILNNFTAPSPSATPSASPSLTLTSTPTNTRSPAPLTASPSAAPSMLPSTVITLTPNPNTTVSTAPTTTSTDSNPPISMVTSDTMTNSPSAEPTGKVATITPPITHPPMSSHAARPIVRSSTLVVVLGTFLSIFGFLLV